MSTKKETKSTTTNQYNPASMSAYNAFQPQLQALLSPYLAGNPLAGQFFQLMHGAALKQANALAGRGVQNIFLNAKQGGMTSAATQAALARQGRFSSGLQANAFLDSARQAYDMQRWAATMAQSYNPLQTGQSSQSMEKTSGLGTWLPQLLQAGMGAAMGFMNPMAAGGAFGSLGSGPGGALMSRTNPSAFQSLVRSQAAGMGALMPTTPFISGTLLGPTGFPTLGNGRPF